MTEAASVIFDIELEATNEYGAECVCDERVCPRLVRATLVCPWDLDSSDRWAH